MGAHDSLFVNRDRKKEAIPKARNSFDETRLGGRIPQNFAQFFDRCIQTVFEVNECVGTPELVANFVSGDEFAGVIQKHLENQNRLAAQLDAGATLPQFPCDRIQLEGSKTICS